jgi:PAS domain-containing protein
MDITVFNFFWAAAVSIGTLAIALYFLTNFISHDRQSARELVSEASDTIALVYNDTKLVDATDKAYAFLRTARVRSDDWTAVFALLTRDFPNLGDALGDLAQNGRVEILSEYRTHKLVAEWWKGLVKISVYFDEMGDAQVDANHHSVRAIESELVQLREIANTNPSPTWQSDETGTIVWANDAYMSLAMRSDSDEKPLVWPLPHIFGKPSPSCITSPSTVQRKSLEQSSEDGEKWFDITSRQTPNGIFFYATPADEIVQTQASLSSFTQTLTKTFAQLTQGLAIFDKDRNLMMFNPALVKLTKIPADKLCTRPSLWGFLDNLRELRMIPEPKDYHSWRKEISELEAAAETDSYCKIWQLPSGQTYRVTGRPHPGGAIAILFENISEEISLSRRYTAHLEQNQAILDSMDEAIAVFSASGVMIQHNEAYQALWGTDPDQTLIEYTAKDAISEWRVKSNPTPFWGDLADFIYHKTERSDWDSDIVTGSGDTVFCRISPLFGGATLVGFSKQREQKEQRLIPANQSIRG